MLYFANGLFFGVILSGIIKFISDNANEHPVMAAILTLSVIGYLITKIFISSDD